MSAQTHPRMFFDAAEVPALQAKVAAEPYASMAAQIRQNVLSVDYPQRGGNFAATYLLTGDEEWAEMAAYRALDYISNTDRWENSSVFGLRRPIDIVAVMMLYDFCYNSDFWANYTVPATLAPKGFTVNGVTVQIPGNGAGTDSTGKWYTSYTGRTITVPSKYVGLPLRDAISQALRNNADSCIASGGSGWPGNEAYANNWWACRYAGAGLGYLVCDEAGIETNLNIAINNLKTHLSYNLGDSPLGMGWNPEGVAYAQFPGWYTYPFAIALERATGRDLVDEHPNMRFALWSTWQGALPVERTSRLGDPATGTGLGIRPDFDDDHNIWEGEGTGALAFAFAYNDDPGDAIADFDYRAGIKWLYNRLAGAMGDRLWDSASGNGIYSILYYPEDSAIPEENPDTVWGRVYADPSYGAYMFRSGHQDADFSNQGSGFATASTDFVTQTTVNLRSAYGGHGGPDALSLRMIGLGVPWAVGSGRVWSIPAQSSFMPYDPASMGTGTLGVVPFGNEVVDTFLRSNTGDGYVVMRQDTSDTGCENHTRRLVVDYSGNSGAPAMVITYDTADDNSAWWRLNTFYGNAVDVSMPGQFTLTSPEGHKLVGKILYPAGATARTGEIARGNDYSYKGGSYSNNKWVDFAAGSDGHALVAMVIVPAGDPVPVISATGDPASGFTVTAGAASFTLNASDNTVVSPYWNPPSVEITDPAEGAAFHPAPQDISVSGTASDDGQVVRIDVYLDDVLQHTQSYASASVNWGSFTLSGLTLGDHVITVTATDNAGDTKTVSRNVRLTNSVPPEVSLTSPGSSSQLFAGQTLTLAGLASDAEGQLNRVEIWYGNRYDSPQKLGNAALNVVEGTWTYTWTDLPVGTHTVWAVAYDDAGDSTASSELGIRASLIFSDVPVWGDAANYSQKAPLNGTSRWTVWAEDGDLRLHVREMQNYDYGAALSALIGSNNRDYPNFRLTYKAKIDEPMSLPPRYFAFWGQADAGPVVFDAQVINSVEKPNSWSSAGKGTRIWYSGNSGYRPEIGFTYNMHLTTDPGYPDAADSDYAGIPNDGWNTIQLDRVGKNMKVQVNGTEIIDATHNYIGTRGEVGLGNERGTDSHAVYFDDIDFTLLDDVGDPVNNADATITFTSPAPFANLQAGLATSISGTVSDPEGIVTLEVYAGATLLGEPSLAGGNWSLPWTPAIGQHALVLRVTDSAGFVTESPVRHCKVTSSGGTAGNADPVVSITRDNSVPGAVAVTGSAADPDGTVAIIRVFRDGVFIGNGQLSGGTWNYSVGGLPEGTYTFTAEAWDNMGSSTVSDPLVLNVDAPVVSITAPADGSVATIDVPLNLEASASDADGILSVSLWSEGAKLGDANFIGGVWSFAWTPRFYRSYAITAVATDQVGTQTESDPITVTVVADGGPDGSLVTYAGATGQQRLLDAMELSDGTVLLAGTASDLNWSSATKTQWSATGLPYGNTGQTAFLMHLAADLQSVLGIHHLPAGQVSNFRWIKSTSKPGEATGALYVSGQCNNSTDGAYFIARLNNNFVSGIPTGFSWVKTATMSSVYGDNTGLQTWDVGGDGRVVFVDEPGDALRVFALDASGNYMKLDALRGSHFSTPPYDDANRQAGVGADLPAATVSAVSFPADLRSWTEAERLAILPDGNGSIKRGTWPYDLFYPVQDRDGGTSGVIEYGYTGYKSAGKWRVGGIAVDRRSNDFYIGFNVQSKFWDSGAGIEQPDFEPAVIAYTADGALKWWSRLYHEVVDTNADGQVDPGETRTSSPDQYVDGLAIDYSGAFTQLVVNARAHGNNISNLWSGNAIAANPGGNGFQNSFTGTEGNIHLSWIAKLKADDGTARYASWLSGYFRDTTLTQAPYPEPIHDNWPSHNAGWPNLTTTKAEPGSVRVDDHGRVHVVGVGPRMVTTFNAHQKLPKITPTLDEGIAPWNAFARVYEADLATLVYSSALTGAWTYPAPGEQPEGANNTELKGVFPVSDGALVVGRHLASSGVAEGNPVPVNKVPAWGAAVPSDETALFGRLSFITSANIPPSCALTAPVGTVSFAPGGSVDLAATAGDADGTVTRVEFYANGILVVADTDAPYAYTWTPTGPEGTIYTVQAIAIDDSGGSTASGTATVRLEDAPSISLVSPPNGYVGGLDLAVTLQASASDNAPGYITKVDFYLDDLLIGTDTAAPYEATWTPPSTGTYNWYAVATDNTLITSQSETRTLLIVTGNVAPNVLWTNPPDESHLLAGEPVLLAVDAFDNSLVTGVEFLANGASIGSGIQSGNTWYLYWNPGFLGMAGLTAAATDDGEPTANPLTGFSPPLQVEIDYYYPPEEPTHLEATALSPRAIEVSWSDVIGEQRYRLERSNDGTNWTLLANLSADAVSYRDSGLSSGTSCHYRLRAENWMGESAWAGPVSATPTGSDALATFVWTNGSGSGIWNTTDANWTGAGTTWTSHPDLHVADFTNQGEIEVITVNEAVSAQRLLNLKGTLAGSGSLQLGDGGLKLGKSTVIEIPITLLCDQTWDLTDKTLIADVIGGADRVLTLTGKPNIVDFKAWDLSRFPGTLRLLPYGGQIMKIELGNGLDIPCVVDLVDTDPSGNRTWLKMRSSYKIGGLLGDGRAYADLEHDYTLTLDVMANRDLVFEGDMTGVGTTLVKKGHGSQAFAGMADYGKRTIVEEGTLRFESDKTGSGDIEVRDGATLAAISSVNGLVTVQSGASLIPGDGTSEMVLPAGAVLEDGAKLKLLVGSGGGTHLHVTGGAGLTLPANGTIVLELEIQGTPPVETDVFQILLDDTGLLANEAGLTWILDYGESGLRGGAVSRNGNAIELTGLVMDPYAAWRQQQFPGMRDPVVISRSSDPEGDGRTNFWEWALGLDPLLADPTPGYSVMINERSGAHYLRLRFQRPRPAPDTLQYHVDLSNDLQTWDLSGSGMEVFEPVDLGGGLESVEAEVSSPLESEKAFLRLRVEETP
ncbi:MAG: Ig-like domain-containing protein [Oceanipulchritudo sp.]